MKNEVFWLRFSLVNLFIVAILGTLMRYKIAFSLPQLDQKFIQEAHSHFAFYGWVTQILYVLMLFYIEKKLRAEKLRKYRIVLWTNAIGSVMMIPTFLYAGYYWFSIVASAICLFAGFAFLGFLVSDFRKNADPFIRWFKMGLALAAFSSLGIAALSYVKSTGLANQDLYLAGSYFYLHFQYNGCFIFIAIGLLLEGLKRIGVVISTRENNLIYYPMLVGTIIGFGLSVLWLDLPKGIYWLIVAATGAQTFGAFRLLRVVKMNWRQVVLSFSTTHRVVLWYVGFAFSAKIILQLISVIPQVSQFAFGFRNVVIAYLHLVLLMCISTFLLNQILATNRFWITKTVQRALYSILFFIFLNQAILGIIGLFSIKYIGIPYTAPILVVVSAGVAISVLILLVSLKVRPQLKLAS